MFKFLLVAVLFLSTMLLGCAVDYSKPFVQCTVWTDYTVGRGSNECLNYELACVKPLVIRETEYTLTTPRLSCVLPENYGKTSPSL